MAPGLINYLRNRTPLVALAASLIVAIHFAAPAIMGKSGGNPAFKAVGYMTQATLADIAPALKTTPESGMKMFAQQRHAATSGADANRLLFSLIPSQ